MDEKWMKEALKQAEKALLKDEVPIGCVIVQDDKIIARGYNQKETKRNVLMHAELIAISRACRKLNSWRLEDCTLYVTLEPCVMCTGAISQARISRVVYGASEKRWLAFNKLMENKEAFNHYPQITGGVLGEECAFLISDYFKRKRL